MTNETFIKNSLEFNLFYLRMLREHAFFITTSLPDKNQNLKNEAKQFYDTYNAQLKEAIDLSYGVIEIKDDAVTKYTLEAEQQTSFLTGFEIDIQNTKNELNFAKKSRIAPINNFPVIVGELNEKSIGITRNFIRYKTKLIDSFSECKIFINMYPLMLDHLRREAITFIDILNKLQNRNNPLDTIKEAINEEVFWNDIMGEHAEFIRGLLDPSEKLLFNIANETAQKFEELNKSLKSIAEFKEFTVKSLTLTKAINKFKEDGVVGLLRCQISSIIPPLLADHVLRESNHYLRLLDMIKKL